jgi:hypothetical protein
VKEGNVEYEADWQEAARRNLTAKAWAYMKSGATDERSRSPSLFILITLLCVSPDNCPFQMKKNKSRDKS